MSNKVVLVILDGWGVSSAWAGNVLNHFNAPNFYELYRNYPHFSLSVFDDDFSDFAVNNPANSYAMIGAGKKILDDGDQISRFFEDKKNLQNPSILEHFAGIQNLHILGFLDYKGVSGRADHIIKFCRVAKSAGVKNIFLHLSVDSGINYKEHIFNQFVVLNREILLLENVQPVSLFGAKYFKDEPQVANLKKLQNLLFLGKGLYFKQSLSAVFQKYYAQGFQEKDFPASCLKVGTKPFARISPQDAVLNLNLCARESNLIDKTLKDLSLLGWGVNKKFQNSIKIIGLFDLFKVKPNSFSLQNVLEQNKKMVFKIIPNIRTWEAGYYFNGGARNPQLNERYEIVQLPSLKNDIMLGAPEMFARYKKNLKKGFDLTIVDFINPLFYSIFGAPNEISGSMFEFDKILGDFFDLILSENNNLIVTGSFGNAEEIFDKITGERHTTNTRNFVPCIVVCENRVGQKSNLADEGSIPQIGDLDSVADIAPTILKIMGLSSPTQMTGKSLI
ncbi:MAG: 2,3-bisphosphoglycerate-independent phosphoglycerate mutase [Candidatus Berkelbacteria bacterium Licking1014_7]|uniref:phosphoglycerate mutase (2,3-diphosphoglycerate-independent) n=1 Tax=Candidatus Berkelbacteria bacterium Licking1014_7 TaxID=2017147 RepID=A0A554LHV7_9BACT|nr:MAG: 2,3-bisphosphoglycerate-independent phosphoglycerate mutase [Candidatus Berkelbacteria bacterium Licking1014_7]